MKRVLPILLVLILVVSLAVPAFAAGSLKITPPKCSPVVVGNKLANVTLSGGSAVDSEGNVVTGTFVWLKPQTQLTGYGTYYCYECVFYPDDSAYQSQICYPAVAVYRISLTVATKPDVEGTLAVGEPLSDLTLTGGMVWNHFNRSDRPAGHFEFVEPDTTFSEPGEYSVAVVFIPDNEVMYNRATVTYERDAKRNFIDAYIDVNVTADGTAATAETAGTATATAEAATEVAADATAETAAEATTDATTAEADGTVYATAGKWRQP